MSDLFPATLSEQIARPTLKRTPVRRLRTATARVIRDLFPATLRPRCHPERRLAHKGLCRPCYDRRREARKPELREKRLAYRRNYGPLWYAQWREKKNREVREKYANQDIAVRRESSLMARYRMSLADYDQMLAAQGGVCAICHRPPRGKTKGKRLYVDHDHVTGNVRGLLCAGCNTSLGQFAHDPEIIRAAARYLEREVVR